MRSKKEKSGKQINRNRRAIEMVDSYLRMGWTKTAIAEHCNIALSTIRRWEEGSSPNLSTMRRLESIQTAIVRELKASKRERDIQAWHRNGGMELVKEYRELKEKGNLTKAEEDRYWELNKHESDGYFLNLYDRDN